MSDSVRTQVSIHLTKILVLFGRLNPEYNPRQLPLTVHLIQIHLRELVQLRDSHREFDEVFKESVEIRENYTKVFVIPYSLLANPSLNGLIKVVTELVDPLAERYCTEERRALSGELDGTKHPDEVVLMLRRTKENCGQLLKVCQEGSIRSLLTLQTWCDSGLDRLI